MGKRLVRDVIAQQQPVLTASASTTVRDAACQMAEKKVGSILVMDGNKLSGIFTERDALMRVLAKKLNPDTTTLAEVMTANPTTICSDKLFRNALHLMEQGGYRHVPVMDGGRPVGIVSVRDAIGAEMVDFEKELEACERIAEEL